MTCIRHGSVTPVEALAYLLARGFVIESDRSLEVVRKALKAESKGIRIVDEVAGQYVHLSKRKSH
jgi:hypothetical protein